MSSEYHVTEILSSRDAQYGKKLIAFKTEETGDRSLSCFTPYPDTVQPGKAVYGDITEKSVNGKTFYNFAFAKREGTNSTAIPPVGEHTSLAELKNLINLRVMPEIGILRDKANEVLAALDRLLHLSSRE